MSSHSKPKPLVLLLGILFLLLFTFFFIISSTDTFRFVPNSFKTEKAVRPLPLQDNRHLFLNESKLNSVQISGPRITNATVRLKNQLFNVFSNRLHNIDYYCHLQNHGKSHRLPNTVRKDMIFIDDVHKLAYCMIPKSASTNWRRTLLALVKAEMKSENRTAEEILPTLDWSSCSRAGKLLTTYSSKIHSKKNLNDYFLFTFVRHPFERVLSAYRSKLAPDAPSGNGYFRKYARSMSPHKNSSTFSFDQYINYLANQGKESKRFERHWARIVDLCNPCPARYQFIGKTENLKQESEYLLQKLGLAHVSFPDDDRVKSRSVMNKYYAGIDDATMKKLYKVYEDDFLMYNFSYYHPGKTQSDMNV